MGVNGISNVSAVDSSFRFSGAADTNDSSVTAIERRIEALQQSIDDAESNDKLTAEERKKRVEQYQQQIQQLQMQKQQIVQAHEKEARERQQAEMQAQLEEQQKHNTDEEHPEREAQKISDSTMNAMTSISTTMDMHSSMSALRTKMIGEAGVTGAEAKLDAARGMDTSVKDAQVADTNQAVNQLTAKMVENLNDTATNLQKANQSDAEKRTEDHEDANVTTTDKTEKNTAEENQKAESKETENSQEEKQHQERIRITEDGKKQNVVLPEGYSPVDVYR